MRRGNRILAAGALLSLLLAACAQSPSASPGASVAPGGTTVNVTLQEWAVLVDTNSVPAGEVKFAVTNDGPDDVHELVIIRTDLDPGVLPTDATGAVDEASGDLEVVDKIQDVAVGDSQTLIVDLDAGSYVLVCNIYTDDTQEAHYAMGMRIAFTVEGG